MKRGLVVLDPEEIPETERRDRVAALQRAMSADGLDVALIYGDVSRSDDIAYLTNLCIYWNEGILAVPAEGEPVFLTKLSPRVHPWMRLVSTVTDIHSGRNFGDLAAAFLGPGEGSNKTNKTVGLVDSGLWPALLAEEIRHALPGWDVRDTGDLGRAPRLVPSDHERALLRRGGGLLARAADDAAVDGMAGSERIAAAERGLRDAGFLDALARAQDAPGGVTWLEVTGQYRNLWLHASRLADAKATAWPGALQRALATATAAARAGMTAELLAEAAAADITGLPLGAAAGARWVHQADMATNGEYARYPADLPIPDSAVVVLAVEAVFPDGRHAAVADTVAVGPDRAESLTSQETTS
ncbi:MAG TPA: aminopeptidase P family N-terminal domain-containing protein [Trebonia sp.]